MKVKPERAKPISEGTGELGRQFLQALLDEGHDYRSIKANLKTLLAKSAMAIANKKLASNSTAVLETTGNFRGAVGEASKILGVTRNQFGFMLYGRKHSAKASEEVIAQ